MNVRFTVLLVSKLRCCALKTEATDYVQRLIIATKLQGVTAQRTNYPTSCRTVFLVKLILAQLGMKFASFCENLRFITFHSSPPLVPFLIQIHPVCAVNRISADPFLGAFAKLGKATIRFVMSVCPSVRMEQLDSHWTDFDETSYLKVYFRKFKVN